jgi:hypothetical protein
VFVFVKINVPVSNQERLNTETRSLSTDNENQGWKADSIVLESL